MDHDNKIEAWFQGKLTGVNNRPQLAFEPVANNRSFQPPTRAKPYTTFGLPIRHNPEGQRRTVYPASSSVDVAEGFSELKPCRGRSGLFDRANPPYAGMSCHRPLRRRRPSVLRPPRELMRLRKPCVRFLLRFDLFRSVFFIVRIIRACEFKNQGEIA